MPWIETQMLSRSLITFFLSQKLWIEHHCQSIVNNVCWTYPQPNITWEKQRKREGKKFIRIHLLNDVILLRSIHVLIAEIVFPFHRNRVTFLLCLIVQSIDNFLNLLTHLSIAHKASKVWRETWEKCLPLILNC